SGTKLATALAEAHSVNWQAPVPVQPPFQPAKRKPGAGAARRVTSVPGSHTAKHDEPQSIPAGSLVTEPPPEVVTVSFRPSVTVTVKLALAVLPARSRAEQTTVVVPTGKLLPDAGAHETGTGPSTRSLALGLEYETAVPPSLVAGAEIPPGTALDV